MRPSLLGTVVIASTLMASCGSDSPLAEKQEYDFERTDSLPADYLRETGNIRVSIEQVAKFNEKMKESSFSYKSSIVSNPGKASSYSNSKVQAMNLGIYGADLNYAVSFDQSQDIASYLDAVMKLSENLGVQSAFDRELIEKITSNDTVMDKSVLLTRAYQHTEDFMYSEDRAHLATLMVTGGWVESLFLATTHFLNQPLDGQDAPALWDNAYTYHNVRKMLVVFQDNYADCKDILVELETLNAPIQKIIKAKYSIKPEHINELHAALTPIRNKMVNMS